MPPVVIVQLYAARHTPVSEAIHSYIMPIHAWEMRSKRPLLMIALLLRYEMFYTIVTYLTVPLNAIKHIKKNKTEFWILVVFLSIQ